MAVATLDALAAAKELKAAGFNDERAEAVSKIVRRAQDLDLSNLSTKADVAGCKAEILNWVLGAMGLQTVAILGALLALVEAGGHP